MRERVFAFLQTCGCHVMKNVLHSAVPATGKYQTSALLYGPRYTTNSKKVVLQKPSTFNSKRARDDGCCYLEPRSGQFTLVSKQIYTLSVFMIYPGIVTM